VIVTADDGTGFAVNDTFVVTITPVNDPPVVSTPLPNINFPEDGSHNFDLDPYAGDIDNNVSELNWAATVITAQPIGGNGGGSGNIEVDPSDLQVSIDPLTHVATFTATGDTSGIFTVAFTVSDPGGLSDNDTMQVTVTGVNDPPFVVNPIPDQTYPEDSGSHTAVQNLNTVFSDPDPGATFTFSAAASNANILPQVQGTSLVLNSALNYTGTGDVFVTANDGAGRAVASDTFSVTYTPVNDPPVVSTPLPDVTFPEDGSHNLDLDPYASDIDNNSGELSWAAVVINAQSLGANRSNGKTASGKSGGSGNIEVDPSDLQISIDPLTHVATFTATGDSSGIFTVAFTVSDPGGLSDNDTMQVTVTAVNDPPFVVNPISDQTYVEDGGAHTAVQDLNTVFSDPDPGFAFTFSAAASNANILPQVQGDSLVINSALNYTGTGNVTVTANDGAGRAVASDTFSVTYTPVNDPPAISANFPNLAFPEDSVYYLDLDNWVNDVDNIPAVLSWQARVISAQSNNLEVDTTDLVVTIDPLTHVAAFTPTPDSTGIFQVEFVVEDPEGLSDTDTMEVKVLGASDPPFVVNPIPDVNYPEDGGPHVVVGDLNIVFFDPDPSSSFVFSAVSNNPNIPANVQGNDTLVVNSALNYNGSGTVIVTADDGTGFAVSDTFIVTITPVNDPPVVSTPLPDVTFPEDGSYDLDLNPYASDIDNSTGELSWVAVVIDAQPAGSNRGNGKAASGKSGGSGNIEVDPSDLQISIDPLTHLATFAATSDTSGIFQVVFTVSDPGGLSDNDTMRVVVTGVGDPPFVINPIDDVVYPEDIGSQTVVANLNTVFSDPDPGTVFFFNAAASNPNILPFVQGVSLKLNSVPNFFGSGNVVVSANDGFGRTVVRDTFAVTYTPVNDPPVVSAAFPNVIFAVNTSDSLDLDQYVIDADHDTTVLNWQAKVISAQPMPVEIDTSDLDVAIDPLTHVATFSATPDSGGIFHVKFTVSDPAGLSDTDTIKVTVYGAGISPSVVNPIPDVSYPEDSGLHIVANDLNTVFFDPDPTHTFSFSTASGNQNIQLTIQGNTLWVGSSANFFGSSDAIVFADNGNGVTLSDTFQVTITPVNDPPAISSLPDTVTFASNTSTDLDVWQYVSDLETADSLLSYAFTVSNDSLLKSYNAGSGILTLSAAAGFTGDVTLRIRITDPENATAEDTLTVVVSPIVGIYGPNGEMPLEFALEQNYPNPFNPATTIKFQMPAAESVRLVVYNILGQKVRILVDERLEAGYHQVHWDGLSDQGQQLASGIYIYRIEAGNFTVVRKMTLLK